MFKKLNQGSSLIQSRNGNKKTKGLINFKEKNDVLDKISTIIEEIVNLKENPNGKKEIKQGVLAWPLHKLTKMILNFLKC